MADDLTLKITIPKADDKAFIAALDKMLAKLDQVEKKVKQVDKATAGLGKKAGSGTGRASAAAAGGGSRSRVAPVVPIAPVIPGLGKGADQSNKKLRAISQSVGLLGSVAGGAGGKLGSFTSRISTLNGTLAGVDKRIVLVTLAIAALTLVTLKSVKAFSEFEASLGNVSRVANLGVEGTEAFGRSVLAISADLPITTREVFKFADALANAGLTGDTLDSATRSFSKLGTVVKNLDTSKVQDILRLRQLSRTGDSFDQLNSKILKLSQSVVATVPQITKTASQAAAAFAGTGAGLDEILSIGATAAGQTKRTQRLVTSLGKVRQALSALNTIPDEGLQSILNTLKESEKISVDAFRALAAGPGGVTKAFDKLLTDSTDLTRVLDELGLSAKSVGNTLVRSFAKQEELLKKARDAIKGTDVSGVLDEQAAERAEEFSAKITQLGNSFSELFIKIGGFASIIIKPFVEVTTTIIQSINDIIGVFSKFVGFIPGWVVAVGALTVPFLQIPAAIFLVVSAVNAVVDAIAGSTARAAENIAKDAAKAVAQISKKAQQDIKKLGDVRLLDKNAISEDFIRILDVTRNKLTLAGISAGKIKEILASLPDPVKALDSELERVAKQSDIIAQNLQRIRDFASESAQELADIDFELEIASLDAIDKEFAKIDKVAKEQKIELNFDVKDAEKKLFDALDTLLGVDSQVAGRDIDNLDAVLTSLDNFEGFGDAAQIQDARNLVTIFREGVIQLEKIDEAAKKLKDLAIDEDFNKSLSQAFNTLKGIQQLNLSPIQKAFDDLGDVLDKTFASDDLKAIKVFEAQANVAKAFALSGKEVNNDISTLQDKLDNIQLKGLEKTFAEIAQNTKKALEEVTLPEADRENASDAILKKEQKAQEGILRRAAKQQELAIRNDEQAQLKRLQKDREQILTTQAEGVAAVTDAGTALESVNQAQRTNELQEELLTVNEQQLKELKKQTKQKVLEVIFPPAR